VPSLCSLGGGHQGRLAPPPTCRVVSPPPLRGSSPVKTSHSSGSSSSLDSVLLCPKRCQADYRRTKRTAESARCVGSLSPSLTWRIMCKASFLRMWSLSLNWTGRKSHARSNALVMMLKVSGS
jgi:hypothetical protein